MNPMLSTCLQARPEARVVDQVGQWWAHWLPLAADHHHDTAALAMAAGFAADRVAWAFAGGYQAALRALVPDLPHDVLAAFCVTEAGGNRPRDIRTVFAPQADGRLRINGAKRWTTLGPAGALLLVFGALERDADAETPDQARPVLRVARVPVPCPGLVVRPMPATRFVPEVPHAELQMQDLRLGAEALLPGDGYDLYVKPFRTLEDMHVTLAVLAYLLREARSRQWPAPFNERLVAAMALLCTLAAEDARSAATHIALAGALHMAHALYADARALWADGESDAAALRWQRDSALFDVAGSARGQRAARAWQRLGEPG